jgi:hypothetical protein
MSSIPASSSTAPTARLVERDPVRERRIGPRADRDDQRVVPELAAGPERDRSPGGVDVVHRVADVMRIEVAGHRRQREPPARAAAERLADAERAVGERGLGRHERHAGAGGRLPAQGDERLEGGDAAARDHDPVGLRAGGRAHAPNSADGSRARHP